MRPLILLRYTLQAALVVYCIAHLIYLSLAHADERQQREWLARYTLHPQHCPLVTSPDDGLVSGRTPRVCASPEAPRYPPGAGRGLLDPQRPERSFAR